jgi:hypothetical protein
MQFGTQVSTLHLKGKSGEDASRKLHCDNGNKIPNCMQLHPKEL